ncbi:MAG: hypothetical protein HYZ42_11995 [Bacteroidetes bacterium]|nr:hypothetical protein [Bacteroidota bacterium]
MHPDKDSVLEKCTQIIQRNINYQKIAEQIKQSVTPEEQVATAKKFVEQFKNKLAYVDAKTLLSNLFMTSGSKEYKVFNETFVSLATAYKKKNTGPFEVDDVTASSGSGADKKSCGKRASKWQKWTNE